MSKHAVQHGPWTKEELLVDDLRNVLIDAYTNTLDYDGPNFQVMAEQAFDCLMENLRIELDAGLTQLMRLFAKRGLHAR